MSTNGYTRAIILDQASELASKFGLARLSAGLVARHITRPKSTVFFHFPTIEQLHLGVLDYAAQELIRQVVRPAYRHPDGLPRLERLVDLWLHWDGRKAYSGGCPFASSAFQFDNQPGPVRNRLVKLFLVWNHMIGGLIRAAVSTGTFRPDIVPAQFMFELGGIMLAHHYSARLILGPNAAYQARRSFQKLVERARGVG